MTDPRALLNADYGELVEHLLETRSLRQLATEIGTNHTTLRRIRDGYCTPGPLIVKKLENLAR